MSEPTPEREITDAERAMADIMRGLRDIERERRRVRHEDWQTLFRQLGDVLTELSGHPFVTGDLQAEGLIRQILRSEDLEELDKCVDNFADYAVNKLQYNAWLRAKANGRDPDEEIQAFARPTNTQTTVTRAQAANGPSGSDFEVKGQDAGADDLSDSRALFRL